jgi:acetyl esterase/lipase
MRILPVGLLLLVPTLLAAQPAPDWQPAPSSKTVTSAPLPPVGTAAPPLRTTAEPVSAGFTPAPPLRATAEPLPAAFRPPPTTPVPPLAGPVSEPRPSLQPKNYGPQRVSFGGGVSATFDVTYQTLKGFRPLTLDVYQPARRTYPLPLVVFVHGGGFNGGDTRHAAGFEDFPGTLAALAAQGYVVASVNYRLSGEARFPAALLDVKAAIRWLRAHAADGDLDTTRVAVWGMASGGQLAALAGVTCGVPALEPADLDKDAPSDCVQAVIDWYGAADMKVADKPETGFTLPATSDGGAFLGCEPAACPPGLARLASPLSYISVTSPPFLIQHGAADGVVSPAQSQALLAALKERGVPAELVIYPGVGHDFTRGGQPDPAVNREALAKIGTFLAGIFPPGPVGVKTAQQRGPVY